MFQIKLNPLIDMALLPFQTPYTRLEIYHLELHDISDDFLL